uniref:Uncharacterized protein n=1 Tax=Nelumbo nucifera TaxID=4432 RepID=A0A822YL69_NELNU|nr:TPA_asm: hypothetical protein HUJ06_010507 [Nelumbo nucifera]
MASLSRRLSRSFILTAKPSQHSTSFCTNIASNDVPNLEDSSPGFDRNSSSSSSPSSSSSSTDSNQRRPAQQRPLENGIDIGVYKCTLSRRFWLGRQGRARFRSG